VWLERDWAKDGTAPPVMHGAGEVQRGQQK